jgi:hypothetical protein
MSTFEITIERKSDEGWPVVAERTSPGTVLRLRAEGVLALGDEAENALRVANTPQESGTVRGRALFRHQVCDADGCGITTCGLRTGCVPSSDHVARQLRPQFKRLPPRQN